MTMRVDVARKPNDEQMLTVSQLLHSFHSRVWRQQPGRSATLWRLACGWSTRLNPPLSLSLSLDNNNLCDNEIDIGAMPLLISLQ